jgi:hypothetical protein
MVIYMVYTDSDGAREHRPEAYPAVVAGRCDSGGGGNGDYGIVMEVIIVVVLVAVVVVVVVVVAVVVIVVVLVVEFILSIGVAVICVVVAVEVVLYRPDISVATSTIARVQRRGGDMGSGGVGWGEKMTSRARTGAM